MGLTPKFPIWGKLKANEIDHIFFFLWILNIKKTYISHEIPPPPTTLLSWYPDLIIEGVSVSYFLVFWIISFSLKLPLPTERVCSLQCPKSGSFAASWMYRPKLNQIGTNGGKATRLLGNIFPREVPKLIGLSWGAQPQRTVWLAKRPPMGIFFLQTNLWLFHCLSDFAVQKPKRMQPTASKRGLRLSLGTV